MESIRNVIKGFVGIALIAGVVLSVTPECGSKRVLRTVCGFAVIMTMLGLFFRFDYKSIYSSVEKYSMDVERIISSAQDVSSNETRTIIEEKSAAYILDKAKEIDLPADVSVTAKWNEQGFWCPAKIKILCAENDEKKAELSDFITAELGIDANMQEWIHE